MREQLADLCHEQWSGWMNYILPLGKFNADGSWTMPPDLVARWSRQMSTPYSQLSEDEKNSDRKEADKFIEIVGG